MPAISNEQGRQNEEKFVVRFPDGYRDRLAVKAKESSRSMNSEIIYRMDATLNLEEEVSRLKAVIDQLLAYQKQLGSSSTEKES